MIAKDYAEKAMKLTAEGYPDAVFTELMEPLFADAIATARAEGRQEALEEAAKVAEDDPNWIEHPEHIDGCCGHAIARAIRAKAPR